MILTYQHVYEIRPRKDKRGVDLMILAQAYATVFPARLRTLFLTT